MVPCLSIVIANYNYGRFIETAIRSVVEQVGIDSCELIVIDGGSTDNSVEIIKKYANGLPPGVRRDDPSIVRLHLPPSPVAYWISEPDKGQSDAFNKGFAVAKGKFLTWLNADDILLPGALRRVLDALAASSGCEWFAANAVYFSDDGKVRTATVPVKARWVRQLHVPGWMCANGPSTFFSRELLNRVGPIREDLHYVMDTELWMRFCRAGVVLRIVPDYVWGFRLHEASKTASSISEGRKDARFVVERTAIRAEYGIVPKSELRAVWRKRLAGLLSGGYWTRRRVIGMEISCH